MLPTSQIRTIMQSQVNQMQANKELSKENKAAVGQCFQGTMYDSSEYISCKIFSRME